MLSDKNRSHVIQLRESFCSLNLKEREIQLRHRAEGWDRSVCILQLAEACQCTGTVDYPSVAEDEYLLVPRSLLLHQEATHTIILHPQGLAPRRRVINVAKEKLLSALIYDDIRPELTLPFPEVHLLQSIIDYGIRIATEGSELAGTPQRARENPVKG